MLWLFFFHTFSWVGSAESRMTAPGLGKYKLRAKTGPVPLPGALMYAGIPMSRIRTGLSGFKTQKDAESILANRG
jgi:hypothetical protein